MKTDGFSLWSYALLIGETERGCALEAEEDVVKVLHDYTAGGLGFVSITTSQHVNLARRIVGL